MAMDETARLAAARTLVEAEAARRLIAPLGLAHAGADMGAAYAVQRLSEKLRNAGGTRTIGRKVAMTSAAVQRQFGIASPTAGALHASMLSVHGEAVSFRDLLQPKVEAEVAFVLGADLEQPDLTLPDVLRAVDFALVAIEIAECRIDRWAVDACDFVADNSAAGKVVLGETPLDIRNVDLRSVEMELRVNEALRSTGTGSACLGSPLLSLLWLARFSAAHSPLRRGELVMTGSLGPALPVGQGDLVHVRIGGFPPVSVRFQ